MEDNDVRWTSKKAWEEIKRSGLLSQRRWEVYDCIYKHGPIHGPAIGEYVPGGWKRVSELAQLGVIEEIGVTTNKKTNKTVYVVQVTGRLPSGKVTTARGGDKGVKQLLKEMNALIKCGGALQRAVRKEVERLVKTKENEAKRALLQHHLDNWNEALEEAGT